MMIKLQLPKGAFELGARVRQVRSTFWGSKSTMGKIGTISKSRYTVHFDLLPDGSIEGIYIEENITQYWQIDDDIEHVVIAGELDLLGNEELEVEIE